MLSSKLKRQLKKDVAGYLFTLPVILGVIIFTYIPAVQSMYYSFFDTNGFLKMDFVGLKNFKFLFNDIESLKVFTNTAIYTAITVPLGLVLGYGLALFANAKLKGITFYRLLFYLPVIIPGVAAGLLWRDLFDPTWGVLSQIVQTFGFKEPTFFAEARTSMATLILTTTWGMGGGMVIWLAAFKNIPISLYESASLDGANPWQRLIKITIPMTTPMIFYNLVTSLIGTLQISSTLIIAGGTSGKGIDGSLYFIAVKIYNEAFTRGAMGYACALGWVLFVIIAILTGVTFKANKWVQYAEEY